MIHTNVNISPVSLNGLKQGTVLHSANNPSPSLLFLLIGCPCLQSGCGPVECGMSLYGAPHLSSLYHLLLSVISLSLSELQPGDGYIRRVEVCDFAPEGQSLVGGRSGGDDFGNTRPLDEAYLEEVGQLMYIIVNFFLLNLILILPFFVTSGLTGDWLFQGDVVDTDPHFCASLFQFTARKFTLAEG